MKEILMSTPCFSYTGRIDFTNKDRPTFIWAGSFVAFSFVGTDLDVVIDNFILGNGVNFGYVIDGTEYKADLVSGVQTVTLAKNLCGGKHDVIIFKRMESGHYFTIEKILVNDDAIMYLAPKKPEKRIEVYGDSVSAGEVTEAVENVGQLDPENNNGQWDNAWQSYPMMMSRMLPAEVYDTSQGGISLFDSTGYFEQPNTKGLEFTYNKLRYNPRATTTTWDFSRFVPHVIIIAIGQNDAHPNPDCLRDKDYYDKWTGKYIEIVRDLHKNAPKATFVLTTTVLMHEKIWDDALEDIKERLADEMKIHHFLYSRNGAATPGHPRIPEQKEMAEELTAFLRTLPEDTWED